MKTKHLFLNFISSVLLFACTTDDSVLNDATLNTNLENTQENYIILTDNISAKLDVPRGGFNNFSDGSIKLPMMNNCNYNSNHRIYFSFPNEISFSPSFNPREYYYTERSKLFNDRILNPLVNGCLRYQLPESFGIKYDRSRSQHYEIWAGIGAGNDLPRPGGDEYEIEL